jgi:hypothetical protein
MVLTHQSMRGMSNLIRSLTQTIAPIPDATTSEQARIRHSFTARRIGVRCTPDDWRYPCRSRTKWMVLNRRVKDRANFSCCSNPGGAAGSSVFEDHVHGSHPWRWWWFFAWRLLTGTVETPRPLQPNAPARSGRTPFGTFGIRSKSAVSLRMIPSLLRHRTR